MQEAARDRNADPELPALFDDLELGDALDAALPTLDGPDAGSPSRPPILGLDLRDLPAPVGPRPRSPLSTAGRASGERRRPVSSPALVMPAAVAMAARGPASKPLGPLGSLGPLGPLDAEPAPLPAPPTRGQSGELKVFVPGSAPPAAAADGKPAARPSSPLPRPPAAAGPALPPAGKRVSAPGIVVPSLRELAARETQPGPRRTSQPAIPLLSKPVHALFDASDAASSAPAVSPVAGRPAEPTPVPLPSLPSDESGNPRPTPTPVATAASGSDASETSVLSGQPAASSVATVEPRPVRLGYLIAGLAVLALLLAFIIGHIAGLWPKPPATHVDKPAATGTTPESPPPSF